MWFRAVRGPSPEMKPRTIVISLAACVLAIAPGEAKGELSPEELADQGLPPPAPINKDASPGRPIVYAARPLFAPDERACSPRVPVCVHTSSGRDGAAAIATLDAFERAWQTLTGTLRLPRPDVDPTTLAYDVFVTEPGPELVMTRFEARDVRSRVDRGRAFTTIDRRVKAGCALDGLAATAIARASLFRVAPATEEGTARAQATYLAQLAFPCTVANSGEEIAAFQSRAGRTFSDPSAGQETRSVDTPVGDAPKIDALFASGAAAFWARLDWAFGRNPGAIVTATWALHPTKTPVPSDRWNNQPDTFDVLRKTFKGALSTGGTVNDLWLDFGVARAFLGSADDGQHLPELRTLGELARVPVDWDVPWPAKPRRLAGRTAVHPTGAAYVVIHREGAKAGARLRIETEWERRSLFKWAVVKLDVGGRELGRVVIPSTERATEAQMTLVDLDGVDRLLLVGVNVGDPTYGFDPDDEVWEPHGFVVTIAEE